MNELLWPLAALATLASSWLGVAFVARLCQRFGWLARPREGRWHQRPTALHGGLGFMPVFMLAAFSTGVANGFLPASVQGVAPHQAQALALLLGCLLLLALGFWDDLRELGPGAKLAGQLATASLFVYAGGVWPLTGLYGLDLALTYLWLIGLSNAFNILDNMDGLASGAAIISALGQAALVWRAGRQGLGGGELSLLLAAAVAGFWLHNRAPARIFMGDSGSLSMGFAVGCLCLPGPLNRNWGLGAPGDPGLFLLPLALAALPIFEVCFVVVTRTARARKAYVGGRDHPSHRLAALGLSPRAAVGLLHGAALGGALMALAMRAFPGAMPTLFGIYALLLLILGVYLSRLEAPGVEGGEPRGWVRGLRDLLRASRLGELLTDALLAAICFHAAYLLRFEFQLNEVLRGAMLRALPLVVGSCASAFVLFGVYGSRWRTFGLADLPPLARATVAGTALSLALSALVSRFGPGYSRSAFLIFGVLLFMGLLLSRLSFRLLDRFMNRRLARERRGPAVLIHGTGETERFLAERACALAGEDVRVLGFVGQNAEVGRVLAGLPVRGEAAWQAEAKRWNDSPEVWTVGGKRDNDDATLFAARFEPPARIRRLRLELRDEGAANSEPGNASSGHRG